MKRIRDRIEEGVHTTRPENHAHCRTQFGGIHDVEARANSNQQRGRDPSAIAHGIDQRINGGFRETDN